MKRFPPRLPPAATLVGFLAVGLVSGACATKVAAIDDYVAGVQKFKQRDLEGAEKQWRRAFEVLQKNYSWSESADVAANLGALYLSQHRYDEAIGYLNWSARVRELAREPVPRAKVLLDVSAAERALWQVQQAIQHADEAYAVFASNGNKRGQAEARASRAMAQYAAEDLQPAIASLEEARDLHRAAGDESGEVLTLSRLVFIRDAAGEAQGARQLAEEAVSKAGRSNEPAVRAAALMARGIVRRTAGRLQEAEEDLSAALRTFSDHGDLVGQANALQELGTTHLLSGKPDEALKRFQEASEKFKATKNRGGEARITALIGNAHVYAGDYVKALNSYQEALALKRNIGDQKGEAKILLNLGVVYDFIGDRGNASDRYQQALAAYQKLGDKRGEANALTKYGLALRDERKYDDALKIIEKSLEIQRGLKDPWGESFGLVNLGTILEELGDYKQAIQVYQQARSLKQTLGDRAGEARVLLNLGLSLNMLRDYEGAWQSLRGAGSIAEELKLPELLWQIQFALGAVSENRRDSRAAGEFYRTSAEIIENVRGRLASGTFKADFLQGKVFVYEQLIGLYQSQGNFDASLHYAERSKARAFLDMMGNKRVSAKGNVDKALRKKQVALEARIHSLSSVVSSGAAPPPVAARGAGAASLQGGNEGQARETSRSLERAIKEYQDLQELIQRSSPELGNLVTVKPLETREIQALLDPEVALLEYYIAHDAVYGFIVTHDGVRGHKLALTPHAVHEAVERFRKEVIDEPLRSPQLAGFHDMKYRVNLQNLYEDLIAPFGGAIKEKKHLIIVPHGVLHYLPFQALWDGRQYLIQTHSVSYAPSASVLKFAKEKHRTSRKSFLGVSNPDGTLPQAKIEVDEVAKSFSTRKVLTGAEATEDTVKKDMPEFDVIHLATHGVLDRRLPLLSYLKLAGGKPERPAVRSAPATDAVPPGESRLTLNEVFDLNLQAGLVVLSACETGLVGGYRGGQGSIQGDELVGLARAFIYAGTPTVIATLWNVADLSTGELMINFYRHLKGTQVAEALRTAQAEFVHGKVDLAKISQVRGVAGTVKGEESLLPGDHPYFWAPFIVIGDWR